MYRYLLRLAAGRCRELGPVQLPSPDGSISAVVASLLLLLSIAVFATLMSFSARSPQVARYYRQIAECDSAGRYLSLLLARLEDDLTPEAESRYDIVWDEVRTLSASGFPVELTDLVAAQGTKVYTNVNTLTLPEIDSVLHERLDNQGSVDSIKAGILRKRDAGESINDQELKALFGPDLERLYPSLAALPGLNVNFASRQAILDTLSVNGACPSATQNGRFCDALLLERDRHEMTGGRLASLLDRSGLSSSRVCDLGAHTWLWKASLTFGSTRLTKLYVRTPDQALARYFEAGSFTEQCGPRTNLSPRSGEGTTGAISGDAPGGLDG
ncbi:MAG TPA: hypothetical protein VMW69_10420 [Spirochaetia bacterium]|nr:hypothetical protein [Spirochaetia bacterium]